MISGSPTAAGAVCLRGAGKGAGGTRPAYPQFCRSALVLSSLLVGCSQPVAPSQPVSPQPAPSKPVVENRIDPHLNKTVEQLILVLESGRPEDFPEFASTEGVCFGIDCDSTPLEEIKKEIRAKKGSYCELFDSGCLRKELRPLWTKAGKGEIEQVLSFRDMFKTAAGRDINIKSDGQVHVRIRYKHSSDGISSGFRPEEMDLGFAKEYGNWKLTSMAAY